MNSLVIEIKEGTRERVAVVEFPEKHSEFKRRHLAVLSRFLSTAQKDELAYVRLVKEFLNIPKWAVKQMTADQLFYCEVNETNEVIMLPELEYLKTPYSNGHSLMKRYGIWRGPDDRCKNISIEQIGFADMFANAYAQDRSMASLNRFWGALYCILPWSKRLIPLNEQLARLVPYPIKAMALINYRGMMMDCQSRYPHVFGGGEKDGTERFAWEGTIQKLAKTQTFGSYQMARKTPLPQAMTHFEMNGIEVESMNKKLKKQ